MNFSGWRRLWKMMVVGGISIGVLVLLFNALIGTIPGLPPDQQAKLVRLLAVLGFGSGIVGIIGWFASGRASSPIPTSSVTATHGSMSPAPATTAIKAVSFEKTSLIAGVLEGYQHTHQKNHHCVVFVHGVVGHLENTWKNASANQSFLELMLNDENLHDFDIFAFGYRSRYIRGAPIENAARQLNNAIEELLQQRNYRIVLLAHSMGGLVCMRYILDKLEQTGIPPITGLLLYGTPTTGSELVNVAKLVGFGLGVKIPIIRGLVNLFFRGQRQIADLATGSEFLSRLHDGWALRVVNGGHEKAGAGRMWLPVRVVTGEDDFVVSEASGKGLYGAIDWLPLSYDHVQLVKPTGMNDARYRPARGFLQICRQSKDRDILDLIWHASQEIWASRVARLTRNLKFHTVINEPPVSTPEASQEQVGNSSTSSASCEYDIILEKEVEFGISIGHDVQEQIWQRLPQPVYVHQIGLTRLPEAERGRLTSNIEAILANSDEEGAWSRLFPKVSLTINDGTSLSPGEIVWHLRDDHRYSKWLLRKYIVPSTIIDKIGSEVKLRIHYRSFVPISLGNFSFSVPWIVHKANMRVVVFGKFEYFMPSYRLIPRANANVSLQETATETRREVAFGYEGMMLPGSMIDVHWQPLRSSSPERRSGRSGVLRPSTLVSSGAIGTP